MGFGGHHTAGSAARAARSASGVVAAAALVCLPLAVWPGLDLPFSTPKLWLLAIATAVLWLLVPLDRPAASPAVAIPPAAPQPAASLPAASLPAAPLPAASLPAASLPAARPSVVPPLALPAARASALLHVAAFAWIAAFVLSAAMTDLPALEATLLGCVAPLFALAVSRTAFRTNASSRLADAQTSLADAQTIGATGVALVALLQWLGEDPFGWIGWHAPLEGASVRMRVYGTLGNPNFVGALMAMSLPLAGVRLIGLLGEAEAPPRASPAASTPASAPASPGRGVRAGLRGLRLPGACVAAAAAVIAQAAALFATGSRGAVLGLAVGVVAWASVRWSARASLGLLAVVLFAVLAISRSPARPLQTTIEGRVYLWQVATPHAAERWGTGYGPGALALRFPAWQRAAAAKGLDSRRFAGIADHVHNDYLEALIERGLPGLVTFVLPIATGYVCLRRRRRPTSLLLAGNWAAVMAGAACALVDFPMARPVESIWWWTALAQVHLLAASSPVSAGSSGPSGASGTPMAAASGEDSGGSLSHGPMS